jgi:hypothetical protein
MEIMGADLQVAWKLHINRDYCGMLSVPPGFNQFVKYSLEARRHAQHAKVCKMFHHASQWACKEEGGKCVGAWVQLGSLERRPRDLEPGPPRGQGSAARCGQLIPANSGVEVLAHHAANLGFAESGFSKV